MSIVDNMSDLRRRLEEIEREKRQEIICPVEGPTGAVMPAMHDEDLYPMLCGGGHAVMISNEPSQLSPGPVIAFPEEPLRIPELQTRIEVLRAQVRLHDRLRAETMQALRETEKEIVMLRCRHPSGE